MLRTILYGPYMKKIHINSKKTLAKHKRNFFNLTKNENIDEINSYT